MDRKEFLSKMGMVAGSMILLPCLQSCKKSVDAAPTVNFNLDLAQSSNAALQTPGGYLYSNGVVVAKTSAGDIIAVSQSCTHEGTSIEYQGSANQFRCPNHGATFSNSGTVTKGPATSNLKQYTVTKNGSVITVTG